MVCLTFFSSSFSTAIFTNIHEPKMSPAMCRRIAIWSFVATLLTLPNFCFAQYARFASFSRGGLVSTGAAHRYGLTRKWQTQISLDQARGRVVHVSQHVSSTRAKISWQVTYDRGKLNFSELALDSFGEPMGALGAVNKAAEKIESIILDLRERPPEGIDEAAMDAVEKAAQQVLLNVKNEREKPQTSEEPEPVDIDPIVSALTRIASTTADGLPKLERIVVPEITLFVSTDQGVVHAIDAETGRTIWANPIGRADHPTFAPVANEQYVCIVNGITLYLVNIEDGKHVWQRKMRGVPGAGPSVNDHHVFIPLVTGGVEIYKLYKLNDRYQWPTKLMSTGRGLVAPTSTGSSVCWPTDRGYLYVADAVNTRERFRLEAKRTIVSEACYVPDNKFSVASIDGYVYCVQEFSGEMLWRFSTGQPISHRPVALDGAVFVITDEGELFRIDVSIGQQEWSAPGIREFVAASDTKMYCIDQVGRLVIVDLKTGGRVATVQLHGLDLKFLNIQTDRIIVGNKRGILQCLHESTLTQPMFHVESKVEMQLAKTNKPAAGPGDGADPAGGDGANPFGAPAGGADPFGAPAGADPFGSGASDPFGSGGGAMDKDKNPFGGGSADDKNPFGGGGAGDDNADDKNPFGGAANPFGG